MKKINQIIMTRKFSLKRTATVLMMTTVFLGTQSFAMSDDTTHSKTITYTAKADSSATRSKAAIKLDFSFLRETEKAAEQESIRNFNNDFKLKLNVSAAQKNASDLESLNNFQKASINGGFIKLADNTTIQIKWNNANVANEDQEMINRFYNEFTPKITLDVLNAEQVKMIDNSVLKMFQAQFPAM